MKIKIGWMALAAMVATPMAVPAPANADYWRDGHRYKSKAHYHRRKCGGGNGAVGTIVGGVGGAVIGSAVGGGTAGTVVGGVGGALLGRHLDKKNTRKKNGC